MCRSWGPRAHFSLRVHVLLPHAGCVRGLRAARQHLAFHTCFLLTLGAVSSELHLPHHEEPLVQGDGREVED